MSTDDPTRETPETSGLETSAPETTEAGDATPGGEWPADAGRILIGLARAELASRIGGPTPPGASPEAVATPAWLLADGASFVTLELDGRLRGCIGTLEAHRPLVEDVRSNAVSAAVRDPRFRPVEPDEVGLLTVEVSVLSTPRPLDVSSRDQAAAALRPHVDGVLLQAGRRRGTFLPQVWDQLPDPHEFLDHLDRKAGLPVGYWGEDVRLWTYTVTAWHEVSPMGDVERVEQP